jgi:hypothetical protein
MIMYIFIGSEGEHFPNNVSAETGVALAFPRKRSSLGRPPGGVLRQPLILYNITGSRVLFFGRASRMEISKPIHDGLTSQLFRAQMLT